MIREIAALPHSKPVSPRLPYASGRASCQNQDSRDYGIFRIRPAGVFDGRALIHIHLGEISSYAKSAGWAKRNPEIPPISKILILTKTRGRFAPSSKSLTKRTCPRRQRNRRRPACSARRIVRSRARRLGGVRSASTYRRMTTIVPHMRSCSPRLSLRKAISRKPAASGNPDIW